MTHREHQRTIGRSIAALLLLSAGSSLAGETSQKREERLEREAIAAEVRRESYVPRDQWDAFFRDIDGFSYKMIQPMEQNPDKDWLGLQFTDFSGPRSRIGVMPVQNATAETEKGVGAVVRDFMSGEIEVPLAAIEELLTSAIFNTNRLDVIERQDLEALLKEQDFGDTARVTEQSAAKVGRVLGAQYMLFTAINEWTPKRKVTSSVAHKKKVAEVAISFRIVEVDSSRVTYARTFRATAEDWGAGVPLVFSVAKASPINYAVAACINKAAYDIAMSLKDVVWNGSVVKVDGQTVTINAGSWKGMRKGIVLIALAAGEELIDPETGESLGADTETIGKIRVDTVKEKYSKAVIVEGCEGIKAGDRLEYHAGEL